MKTRQAATRLILTVYGEIFEVETEVASASGSIKMMMEDFGSKDIVPLIQSLARSCSTHYISLSTFYPQHTNYYNSAL